MTELFKKIGIIFIITIMLGSVPLTLLEPLVVHAEEDKEELGESEEEFDVVGGAENVLDNLDTERVGDILGKLSYDERVHYLVTYSILTGDYITKSAYSKLFEAGNTPPGSTDGLNLGSLQMGTDAIVMNNSVGATPESQKDINQQEKDKANSIAKRDKALDAVVNDLTTMVYNTYLMSTMHGNGSNNASNSPLKNTSILLTTANMKKVNTSAKDVANYKYPVKSDVHDKLKEHLSKKIRSVVTGSGYSGDITKLTTGEEYKKLYEKVVDPLAIERDFLDTYSKSYFKTPLSNNTQEEKGLLGGDGGFMGGQNSNTYLIRVLSGKKNIPMSEAFAIINLYGLGAKAEAYESRGKMDYRTAYNKRMTSVYSHAKASVEKKLKSDAFKKNAQTLKDASSVTGVGLNEGKEQALKTDARGLGWVPLHIVYPEGYVDEANGVPFAELLDKFDGGHYDSTTRDVYTSSSKSGAYQGRRLLQLNDIMNIEVNSDSKYGTKKRASPYLSYKYDEAITNANLRPELKMGSRTLSNEIIHYTGFKVVDKDYSKFKAAVKNTPLVGWFGPRGEFGKTESLGVPDFGKLPTHSTAMIARANGLERYSKTAGKVGDMSLGIDNYGNIINGETLGVVVPYWQNRVPQELISISNDRVEYLSSPLLKTMNISDLSKIAKTTASKTEASTVISSSQTKLFSNEQISKFNQLLGSLSKNDMNTYKSALSQTDSTQALAMAIVSQTKPTVQVYNSNFLDVAEKDRELYITSSSAGNKGSADNDLSEFNDLELKEKIKMILDVGFYELFRLTVASMIVDFYTGNISNYGLSNVFYTKLISDSPMWSDMVGNLVKLLIGVTGLYIIYASFKVIRKTMSVADFLKQLLALTLSLLIPTVVYTPLINIAINAPTQKIVGKQMEQMSMVDSYMAVGKEYRETDPLYRKLFGHSDNLRDRTEDYLVDIYTTEHVDGFDVKDVIGNADFESTLTSQQVFKRDKLGSGGTWRKQDLVKVRVSIFDLFEWVVEEGNMTLFEWLAMEKGDAYEGITQYKEYSEDTSVMYNGLGVNISGVEMTASEIYRNLYRNSLKDNIENNITGLYGITGAFRQRSTSEGQGLTDREREAFVRDISLTGDVRESIYGKRTGVSPQTAEVMDRYKVAIGNLNLNNDFFNLGKVLDDLVQYRDMTTTTADGDLYDINRAVIDDYITNLSVVRESVNTDHNAYKQSEYHMIMLRLWFEMNKVLGVKYFPTGYGVDTISMDSYMRLIYVPMGDYFSIETKDVNNVGEYLALRDHPLVLLLLFLPALVLLVVYGLLYMLVFYVLLMVLSLVALVYNHVIKGNHNNKVLLGSMYIIISFGLSKILLLAIWKIMSFALNYSYVVNGGSTYPYMLVHSLVIAVYLYFAISFLWTKVIGSVIKDKANLGGEVMTQGLKDTANKLKGTMQGVASGDLLGKGINNSGKAIKNTLGREGLKSGLTSTARGGMAVGGMAVGGASALANSQLGNKIRNVSVKESVGFIASTLSNTANKATKGIQGAVDSVKTRTGKPVDINANLEQDMNNVKGSTPVNSELYSEYDSIKPTENVGLSEKQQAKLDKDLGTHLKNKGGTILMDTKSPSTANAMVNHMKSMGVSAYQQGSKVLFNSRDYNMSSASDRKALFGGFIKKMTDEMVGLSTAYASTKVKDAMNYTETASGLVSIGVNSAGIATKNLSKLLNSDTIRDNFIIKEEPTLTPNGYLQGNLELQPKSSKQNNHELMERLFKEDDLLRQQQNLGVRETNAFDSQLDLQSNEFVEGHVMSTKLDGMSYQNGNLLYDSNNSEHVSYVNGLTNELNSELEKEKLSREQTAVRATSQVVHGGNSGFEVVNVDSTKDGKVYSDFSLNSDIFNREQVFYGGKYADSTAKYLDNAIVNSVNQTNMSDKNFYQKNQSYVDGLYNQIGKDNSMSEQAIQKYKLSTTVDAYMDELKGTKGNKEVYSKLTALKQGLEGIESLDATSQEMKLTDFENELKVLAGTNSKYNNLLVEGTKRVTKDTDKTVSMDVRKSMLKHLSEYNKVTKPLEGNTSKFGGIKPNPEIDKAIEKSRVPLSSLKSVKVGSDGRIIVETDGRVNSKAVSELMKDVTSLMKG